MKNYTAMQYFGIKKENAPFFLPPYEWYNDSITAWVKEMGLELINFTPGTLSNADYTTPQLKNYRSSETIFNSIINYDSEHNTGLNGFILLMHIGTDKNRTDKFYRRLPALLNFFNQKNYQLVTVDKLLR